MQTSDVIDAVDGLSAFVASDPEKAPKDIQLQMIGLAAKVVGSIAVNLARSADALEKISTNMQFMQNRAD